MAFADVGAVPLPMVALLKAVELVLARGLVPFPVVALVMMVVFVVDIAVVVFSAVPLVKEAVLELPVTLVVLTVTDTEELPPDAVTLVFVVVVLIRV